MASPQNQCLAGDAGALEHLPGFIRSKRCASEAEDDLWKTIGSIALPDLDFN